MRDFTFKYSVSVWTCLQNFIRKNQKRISGGRTNCRWLL